MTDLLHRASCLLVEGSLESYLYYVAHVGVFVQIYSLSDWLVWLMAQPNQEHYLVKCRPTTYAILN